MYCPAGMRQRLHIHAVEDTTLHEQLSDSFFCFLLPWRKRFVWRLVEHVQYAIYIYIYIIKRCRALFRFALTPQDSAGSITMRQPESRIEIPGPCTHLEGYLIS